LLKVELNTTTLVTVRQILMNVLMLLSVRTTLNVRILMDLTSVCVMMDTSDLEMFVFLKYMLEK
jgi:hypothetical protein